MSGAVALIQFDKTPEIPANFAGIELEYGESF